MTVTPDEITASLERAWQETLEVPPSGPRASFFDEGGHSLLAVLLVGLIREDTGVEAPVRLVLDNPEFGELAAALIQLSEDPVVSGGT
jgi:hypothetical protein